MKTMTRAAIRLVEGPSREAEAQSRFAIRNLALSAIRFMGPAGHTIEDLCRKLNASVQSIENALGMIGRNGVLVQAMTEDGQTKYASLTTFPAREQLTIRRGEDAAWKMVVGS